MTIYITVALLLIANLIILLRLNKKDKIEKNNREQEELLKLQKLRNEVEYLYNEKGNIEKNIQEHLEERNNILQDIRNGKEQLINFHNNKAEEISRIIYEEEKKLSSFKDSTKNAYDNYEQTLEKLYLQNEQDYDNKIQQLKKQENEVVESLNKLKDSLSAGVQAQLREREMKDSLKFYKLNPGSVELSDIKILNQVKLSLHEPVILNKLIWTTYFQKPTTEMCNRILGTEKKCGIYKITNIETQQCYIGQSVDVSSRWKDHVKCGLGIDASATNKLYKAMQEYGVWNFTFELLEACPRERLNEKEKFWISLYQSDKYGYNSTKGGS